MPTSNPAFKEKTWANAERDASGAVMTLNGTAMKAGFLGALLVASAAYPWHLFFTSNVSTAALTPFILIGCVGGFITAMITIFKQKAAPITAPIYAIFEGLALGGISAMYEYQYPGVAIQGIALSFAVLGAFLLAFSTKLVRPSQNFMQGVVMATFGIALYYLVAMVMSMFGMHAPMMWDSGWLSVGFSLFVVTIAALNLFIDFNFIEANVENGAPKYMEWYGAFGLMLTMVWLYLEVLRLLSKLRSR
jgi:uncharacterized YccA/Bax inhibitor family protein